MAAILEIATVVAGFVNRIYTFLQDNKPELAEEREEALRSLPDPPEEKICTRPGCRNALPRCSENIPACNGHRSALYLTCSQCVDFQPYSAAESACYCSYACRSADKARHKPFCEKRTSRTALHNGARLLDTTNRTIRPMTYNHRRVTGIAMEHMANHQRVLRIQRENKTDGNFHKIPAHVTRDRQIDMLIYMSNCCQLVSHLYYELIKGIFGDLFHIIELHIQMQSGLPYLHASGDQIPSRNHQVLLLITKTLEFWVLDLTCYQYGLHDYLLPLKKWISKHSPAITGLYPFGRENRRHNSRLYEERRADDVRQQLVRIWYKHKLSECFQRHEPHMDIAWAPESFDMILGEYIKDLSATFSPLAGELQANSDTFWQAAEILVEKDSGKRIRLVEEWVAGGCRLDF